MTPEMNWSMIEVDHVGLIWLFDVSTDEEFKKAFCWKNLKTLLKEVHHKKGNNFDFLAHRLQFVEAYQFMKTKEEGLNQDFYWWNILLST